MPVHFDLIAAERDIRANLAATDAERSNAVRDGKLDLAFAMAMKAFDETRVQFVLAGMTLQNEGVDRNVIVGAVGQALGSMWGNGLGYALGARERHILNQWVATALSSHIGEKAAGKTIETVLAPMQSGSA